jgi:hypothetical protein
MSLLKDIPCKKVLFSINSIDMEHNQDIALFHNNVGKTMNDTQIKQVFDYYHLWNKLKKYK